MQRGTIIESQKLEILQKQLGYKFKDLSLLETALTHSSYANESKIPGSASNERLEFLGDSLLGMVVASLIYKSKPSMSEGGMTRLRAEFVCEKSLAQIAKFLDLGNCLLLGRGEEKCGGRERPSILADAVEAVIAAIYLDDGFESVERIISYYFVNKTNGYDIANTDYKTELQEVIQEKSGQTLSYSLTGESGPAHLKTFTVEVKLNGVSIGAGTGGSKKEAEQTAARAALEAIGARPPLFTGVVI